ncbi:uncharacterized protein G2W53_033636 [Senna tora]|uniref:Uncharacterized protein n=1 Tax=Senna tora TaxID=362788 RepID=A0A834W762_9FABA|nr:uncharacterized protein G2W53_033636 [Senna tora]
MLRLESSWHGRSVDHVLTYSRRQIAVGSQKPSRITRQKTCCASESNTSVRVVFANRSGFDAPIGIALAWEERGSYLNIFRKTNRGQISETFTNYEAKDLLLNMAWEEHGSCLNIFRTKNRGRISESSRLTRQKTRCACDSNTSVRVVFANRSGFDAPIGVFLVWEESGSCLNMFQTTNRGRISETFTNYEKPSRITRQKTCCASESNTLVREPELFSCSKWSLLGMGGAWITSQLIPDKKSQSDLRNLHELRGKRLVAQVSQTRQFANRSGFQAPIGVVLACEERGSCLNIFRTTNRVRILETFTNYEAKDLLRKSVDHVSTYSGRKIPVGSQKPSRITRQKTCCARAWMMPQHIPDVKSRSDLRNLHQLRGKRLVSQHGRSVDNVSTYSGRHIVVGPQKPSRITKQKTCCATESNTSVHVVFANQSGFDAQIGVFMALEER